MSVLQGLRVPEVPGLQMSVASSAVTMVGTITAQNPNESIGAFLKSVHEAAVADGLKVLDVDVTALTFVNSSAIRMFIDWAMWAKNLPAGKRYQLNFKTARSVTWQRTSFVALKALAPDVVLVQS
jgi:hypothetical protein